MRRIIIHHSLTIDRKTLSWSAIRNYHIQHNGWLDIGYHAGIEMVGNEYECLYGRPTTMDGAHTAGANYDSLGFCFVGNYDRVQPSPEMLAIACRRVLAPWIINFNIKLDNVKPHRDFADKSCPGKLFDMDDLRSMLEASLT